MLDRETGMCSIARFKETGFFTESIDESAVLSQKPGFWLPVQTKETWFLGNQQVKTKDCYKNPVFGYP